MAKQVHVRLDDAVYEALSEYNLETNSTVQDSIASAIMMFLKQQNKERKIGNADFKFIDLFAGIGMNRLEDIVFILMNGINTANRLILLILGNCLKEILRK